MPSRQEVYDYLEKRDLEKQLQERERRELMIKEINKIIGNKKLIISCNTTLNKFFVK